LRTKGIHFLIPVFPLLFSHLFFGCEQATNVRVPETPGQPVVVSGDRQLTIRWEAVPLAAAFEVWFGKGETSAFAELYQNGYTTETSVTISDLDNYNTYYVWIKALNNAGKSGFSPRAQGVPTDRAAEREARGSPPEGRP
jgi:hypothetical protein